MSTNETIITDDLVRQADELRNRDMLADLNPEVRRFIERYLVDFEQRRVFFYQNFVTSFETERDKILRSLEFLMDDVLSDRVEGIMQDYLKLMSHYKMDMSRELTNMKHLIEILKEEIEKLETGEQ